VANVLLVEICRRYVAAPGDAFQIKVGLVKIFTAASTGVTNTGAAGVLIANVAAIE
jgi:hypothetical protein